MNSQFLDFKIIHKEEIPKLEAQFTGLNKKGIFLFYDSKEAAQISFLSKILAAVQLDLTQDVLVFEGQSTNTFSFFDIKEQQQISKAIVFGYLPSSLGLHLHFNKYEVIKVNNCQFLFADTLEAIANDKQLKGKLWGALKELF